MYLRIYLIAKSFFFISKYLLKDNLQRLLTFKSINRSTVMTTAALLYGHFAPGAVLASAFDGIRRS